MSVMLMGHGGRQQASLPPRSPDENIETLQKQRAKDIESGMPESGTPETGVHFLSFLTWERLPTVNVDRTGVCVYKDGC